MRLIALIVAVVVLTASPQEAARRRLNHVIELIEQKRPVFGIYTPNGGGPGSRSDAPPRAPADLARDAFAHPSDFLFTGSMEGGVDRGIAAFTDFVTAMGAHPGSRAPHAGLARPLIVKTPRIDESAAANISRQLNLGVGGIMFVNVESADEVRRGLAAMRFASKGGVRPKEIGSAPAYWGMSDADYRTHADLWPLNPDGELINWTVVESIEGLAHVREIAAVKGIGVLWPGAGTLRRVFTTTTAAGEQVFDAAAHERAIQQVLAACKEFHVPCGYPANASDIELRMKQGFSVFVMPWGEQGFNAIEIGRAAAGRSATHQQEHQHE